MALCPVIDSVDSLQVFSQVTWTGPQLPGHLKIENFGRLSRSEYMLFLA